VNRGQSDPSKTEMAAVEAVLQFNRYIRFYNIINIANSGKKDSNSRSFLPGEG